MVDKEGNGRPPEEREAGKVELRKVSTDFPPNFPQEDERPLVILTPSKHYFWGFVLAYSMLYFFAILVVVPVLITGDFDTWYILQGERLAKQIKIFVTCLILMLGGPYFFFIYKLGSYYFYADRLVVVPFLFMGWKRYAISYKEMQVTRFDNRDTFIMRPPYVPSWGSPLLRYKTLVWNKIALGACIPKERIKREEYQANMMMANEILKKHAASFKIGKI